MDNVLAQRTSFTTLLVGGRFRPPAQSLLHSSPKGTPLRLAPEWDNSWDSNAIKVLVRPVDIPEEFHDLVRAALEGSGFELEELLASPEPIQLGYVAKTGGKPLLRSSYVEGNQELVALIGEDAARWADRAGFASLDFSAAGEPLVVVNLGSLRQLWLGDEAEVHVTGLGADDND